MITTILYCVLALVILLMMIVIHEFGHYIVGKILKFKINEFSVGFGPVIFRKKNKKTGEIFSVRLLPLGGYCAFKDEDVLNKEQDNAENKSKDIDVFSENESNNAIASNESVENKSDNEKSFYEQAPWKRILVLLAGATFNFISAIIFSIIFLCVGGISTPTVTEKYSDNIGNEYNVSLLVGDEIVAINGIKIDALNSYADIIGKIDGDVATFTVIRNGESIDVEMVRSEIYVEDGENYFGFGYVSATYTHGMPFFESLKNCIPYTFKLSWMIVGSFGDLITGKISVASVTGPISTITFMANVAQQNWLNILLLLPLIAANLAIFNILPIPALDGAKIVFTLLEWIFKKPVVNRTVEGYIHAIGLMLLFGFCIFVEIFHFIG